MTTTTRHTTTEDMVERDKKLLTHGWGMIPTDVVRGEGARFYDADGKEYLDFLSQTAGVVGAVGHVHPKVTAAIKEQADKVQHVLTCFVNEPRVLFAEKLAAVLPGNLKNNCKMYVSSGGTEANETAIKMAMLATGKTEVISTHYSYHGGSLAMLGLLGQSYVRKGPWARFPGFYQIPRAYCYRCPYSQKPESCNLECAEALRGAIRYGSAGNVAAFIEEPITGNGGHHFCARKDYHQRIREICDEYGVLYIADEVQTGVGKTGKWWGCEYFGYEPDILVTAKAIGGGMPLAATCIRNGLLPDNVLQDQWHIFTFGGSPLPCAAGSATIDVINEERLVEKAARQGEHAAARLNDMADKHPSIGEVRAAGMFIGLEIVRNKATKEVWKEGAASIQGLALGNGVLFGVNGAHGEGNIIKLKPPLVITDEELDKGLDILEEAITVTERSL